MMILPPFSARPLRCSSLGPGTPASCLAPAAFCHAAGRRRAVAARLAAGPRSAGARRPSRRRRPARLRMAQGFARAGSRLPQAFTAGSQRPTGARLLPALPPRLIAGGRGRSALPGRGRQGALRHGRSQGGAGVCFATVYPLRLLVRGSPAAPPGWPARRSNRRRAGSILR